MRSGDVVAGKYELSRRLGAGATGLVWAARHRQTGREFAIKFMHPHLMRSREAKLRFLREARAPAHIGHPAIVDVFDVGELDTGETYLVMELLAGEPLSSALEREPPIRFAEFLVVMTDVCSALAAAHDAGIVHRDLKPENVFVHTERRTDRRRGKVLDFGLSKLVDDEELTHTGALIGTPAFMSPEQARDARTADWRADIWAVGVLLFWGITGQFPHDGATAIAVVYNLVGKPPRSIDEVAPRLDGELRAVIRECLRPVEERTLTAREVGARLARVRATSVPSPSTRRAAVAASNAPALEVLATPAVPQEVAGAATRVPSQFPQATPFGHAGSPPPRAAFPWKQALLLLAAPIVASIAIVMLRGKDEPAVAAPVATSLPAPGESAESDPSDTDAIANDAEPTPHATVSASSSAEPSRPPPQPTRAKASAGTPPKPRASAAPTASSTPIEQLEDLGSGL